MLRAIALVALFVAVASHAAPLQWSAPAPADEAAPVTFSVALRQRNVDLLESALAAVSDPASPQYGHHWTPDAIADTVGLTAAEIDMVRLHLGCDMPHTTCTTGVHRDYLTVTAPVASIAAVFRVQLATYTSSAASPPASPRTVIRTSPMGSAVTVPTALAAFVDRVHGLVELPTARPAHRVRSYASRQAPRVRDDPGLNVDPTVLWPLYGIQPSRTLLGQQSVAEFEGEKVLPTDLVTFQAAFHLRNDSFHVVGPNDGQYMGEGILDIEYIMAVAQGINTTMWSIPDRKSVV